MSAGGTATYTLSFSGTPGFGGTVNLTCTGAPSLSTCTVPSSLPLNGTTPVTATVTVITTARGSAAPKFQIRPPVGGTPLLPIFTRDYRRVPVMLWWLAIALLVVVAGLAFDRKLRAYGLDVREGARRAPLQFGFAAPLRFGFVAALLVAAILATASMPACGGGSSGPPPNPGTPAGTYTLTVTSTVSSGSATLTHNTNLTLTVN